MNILINDATFTNIATAGVAVSDLVRGSEGRVPLRIHIDGQDVPSVRFWSVLNDHPALPLAVRCVEALKALTQPPQLRGLTLWRPWPWAIHGTVSRVGERLVYRRGPKRVENRGWHPYAGLTGNSFLALHSGATYDKPVVEWLRERGWDYAGPFTSDCITGVAFLESEYGACDRENEYGGCLRCQGRSDDPEEEDAFYMGGVGWVLSGVVPLVEPIRCKGNRGLWKLPPEVDVQVRAQYQRSIELLAGQLEDGPRLLKEKTDAFTG